MQNQALAAILLLYRHVLEADPPWLDDVVRAKRPQRLPTVLTQDDVRRVIALVDGVPGLMLRLQYGTGMRLMECLRLRIKDITLSRREIVVSTTMLYTHALNRGGRGVRSPSE